MDGIIIIAKREGWTSRDVVNYVSKRLKTKKVGHTGTLDPLATGVLVLCVGKYTKLVSMLTSTEKEYETTVLMGVKTDTLDITGTILEKEKVDITKEDVCEVFDKFPKEYEQEVPLFSAVHVNGKRLYEYARNNEEVILPKRKVTIKQLNLLDVTTDTFTFKTTVSKGTYIRSLISDIGASLGIMVTMKSLTRTKQGRFSLSNAVDVDDDYKLLTIEDLDLDIKSIQVNNEDERRIYNGVLIPNTNNDELVKIINNDNKTIALYKQYDKDNKFLKPLVIFNK